MVSTQKSSRTYSLWQALNTLSLCLLLTACGGGGGGSGSGPTGEDSGIAGEQRYIGTFVDGRGAAVGGLPVTLKVNGRNGVTDAAGKVEIATDTLLIGNVRVEADGVPLTLFGITRDSRAILFNVTLDRTAKRASLNSLRVTPLTSVSVALAPTCTDCHGGFGDPDCTSRSWRNIHSFYKCNPGVGRPESNKAVKGKSATSRWQERQIKNWVNYHFPLSRNCHRIIKAAFIDCRFAA